MESTGISPVGGLDNLLSAAASSQSVNSALQEFTAAHIQVLNINEKEKKHLLFQIRFALSP